MLYVEPCSAFKGEKNGLAYRKKMSVSVRAPSYTEN